MFKRIIHTFTIFLYLSLTLALPFTSQAATDFEVEYDYTMTYSNGKEYIQVEDETTYTVNNYNYFLPAGIEQTFFLTDYSRTDIQKERAFKLKSLKVRDQYQVAIKYSVVEQKDGIQITVKLPRKVQAADPLTLSLTYNTHDLINKSGNIINMYVPALPKDTQLTSKESFNLTSQYSYNTRIVVPNDFALPSYTQPSKISYSDDSKNRTYTLGVKDRIGKVAWLQFGDSQYYKFKIEQVATKTDNLTPTQISDIAPIVSTNIYKMAIPREYEENKQQTFISNMDPKPTKVERDSDGNLIATFEVPANRDSKIIIEGLISLSKKDITKKEEIPDLNLAEYKNRLGDFPDLERYTQPDTFWESTDPAVSKIAQSLLSKSSSIQELILNDYEYIVGKFDYSFEKLKDGNIRLGAKAALTGSKTICMEYADSMTALLRAQGIPARVAIGYGNDPHSTENNISNSKMIEQLIGHQWTQVWIPDYGWMSVDPTWGESNRTYIGSDLDHILWYTSSSSKQNITDVVFYSAEQKDLGKYSVSLQALNKEEFDKESKSAQSLDVALIKTEGNDLPIDVYIKASLGGRILIYLLPLIATVTVSSILTSTFYYFKRKARK